MSGTYLAAILAGCAAMMMLDRRLGLYLWCRPRRALGVQVIGVAGLLMWDLVCIGLGVFRRGEGPFGSGIEILPHLPIEEPLFLWFLCHFTMVVYTGAARLLARFTADTSRDSDPDGAPATSGAAGGVR